jgi:hypothetical protein
VNTLIGITQTHPIEETKMNNTRTFNPIVALSLAAAALLLLAIGFLAGMNLQQVRIDFGELGFGQINRPVPAVPPSSGEIAEGLAIYQQSERGFVSPGANTEGLAIYHQSERDFAFPQAKIEGMTIYHESEWGNPTAARIKQMGLETYWQSERNSAVSASNEQGLSFYWQSERNIPLAGSGSTDEGMDIYYASERDR